MRVWNEWCKQILGQAGKDGLPALLRALAPDLGERLRDLSERDIRWLKDALLDSKRKWFVSYAFEAARVDPPERLYTAFLQAAIVEPDPSFNKYFLRPLLKPIGQQRVIADLLKRFKKGTNIEKAGIARALLWTDLIRTPRLRQKQCELFVKEFVANTDLEVRRSLITRLPLDPARYPKRMQALVRKALAIAETSGDPHVLQRIKKRSSEPPF